MFKGSLRVIQLANKRLEIFSNSFENFIIKASITSKKLEIYLEIIIKESN